ncbi:hypothetical protein [Psychrobacter sp. LV10R520-6]|uniref:hypothetical protein n=1 Tax=Psychrobacter sp. LV10R520-6 TaxID=1415574 RepID=UPI002AA0C9EA|nr:hypothetical protein [Psychrobacter sp. LV10R520-6]
MMTAETTLVLGANTVIAQAQCTVAFSAADQLKFGQHLGLIWLPLDDNRKVACSPAYLHEPKTGRVSIIPTRRAHGSWI